MAERNAGMGRGLAAILSAVPHEEHDELRQVPLDLIRANPRQPRHSADDEALQLLADSLRARGMIQPVLLRPLPGGRYELVAGERRWRAAQIAGLDTLPAVIREHDDAASLELAVIENMAREDLNPVDQARACAALVEELNLTREEVGLRVGRSRVAVSNLIRLLELPDEALELLETGVLSEGHGRALLLAADNATRRSLGRQAAAESWSVRELETRARAAEQAEVPHAVGGPLVADHPDRMAAIEQIADALGRALGAEVRVRTRGGGYTAQIGFGSLQEALELAARLAPVAGGGTAASPL